MKILVRMPNWLGDAVLALPALRAIIKNFPDSEVWAAASSQTMELLASEPAVTGVLEMPEVMTWLEFFKTAKRWREQGFDLAILLTNSFGSALLAAMARIRTRWGYAGDGRSLLLTTKVARQAPEEEQSLSGIKSDNQEGSDRNQRTYRLPEEPVEHQSLYYLRLLRNLGLHVPEEPEITLSVAPEEQESARAQLARLGIDPGRLNARRHPLVLLNPGAAYGPAKRWSAAKFGEVAASLEKQAGACSIIIGSASETGLAHDVAEAARGSGALRPPVILTGKTTLRELIGIMSWAELLVTNDTGPMHLANALRLPVVAIFGPTDPRRTRPWHRPHKTLHKPVVCWPCWYRDCPYDHRCMESITVEEVVNASLVFLRESRAVRDTDK